MAARRRSAGRSRGVAICSGRGSSSAAAGEGTAAKAISATRAAIRGRTARQNIDTPGIPFLSANKAERERAIKSLVG